MADVGERRQAARLKHLRPPRFDDLGLRRALSDRLLPGLVAAMAFLAALALAGFVAAQSLGGRWQTGAAASLTVQVPQPGAPAAAAEGSRRDAVAALLRAAPGVMTVHALSEGELADLLRPWLGAQGEALSVPLPAVIQAQADPLGTDLPALRAALERAAPGTLVEDRNDWAARLGALAHSLQLVTLLAVVVVIAVAAAVVAVAVRAGLASRRAAIEIVHGLGATDAYIARRFAGRAARLAAIGGVVGALASLPVLVELAALAAPFGGDVGPEAAAGGAVGHGLSLLPAALWSALPGLPVAAGGIGWLTAQFTVRRWLRRLV